MIMIIPSITLFRPRPKCILRKKCIFGLNRFRPTIHFIYTKIYGLIAFWPICVLAKNTKTIQANGLKREIDGIMYVFLYFRISSSHYCCCHSATCYLLLTTVATAADNIDI